MDNRGQTSLEYLYLLAFVVGLATMVSLLVWNLLELQNQARGKIDDYRNSILGKLTI